MFLNKGSGGVGIGEGFTRPLRFPLNSKTEYLILLCQPLQTW